MEVFEVPLKDAKGRIVNPEDAEAPPGRPGEKRRRKKEAAEKAAQKAAAQAAARPAPCPGRGACPRPG